LEARFVQRKRRRSKEDAEREAEEVRKKEKKEKKIKKKKKKKQKNTNTLFEEHVLYRGRSSYIEAKNAHSTTKTVQNGIFESNQFEFEFDLKVLPQGCLTPSTRFPVHNLRLAGPPSVYATCSADFRTSNLILFDTAGWSP
jgi:hypothetical protein